MSLRSLSEALGEPLEVAEPVARSRRRTAPNQGALVGERYAAIEPTLDHPPRSAARVAAIAEQARKTGASVRTLNRWLEAYRTHGLNGLGRRRPADAGQARIVVSRPFDTAFRQAGHAPELLVQIGATIDQTVKALWASRAEVAGWAAIRRDVEFILLETCEALGVAVPEAAMRLSRRHIERFAHFRIVNTYRNDRKAFDDAKPRIRRKWTHLDPMRCVVADVKHVDVIVTRPDGRPAWPKVVGFYDAGTARFFLHPVLCPERESIRQEHVVEAFLAMCEAPGWGVPRQLYLDNGSEFAAFEMLKSHLAVLADADDDRGIIYAKAYNAAAKPIEPGFARLDRYVFSKMEGHVGGDRMVKKTQTVGKPPKPYPHSWEHFCETLAVLIADFNAKPMGGKWENRSPLEWFAEKRAAGWTPITADPLALDSVFHKVEERRCRQGVVNIDTKRFHVRGLAAGVTTVRVAMPWRRGALPLFQTAAGAWQYLEADDAFPAEWTEGAREAGRRQAAHVRQVEALAVAAGPGVDPVEIARRRVKRQAQVALPASIVSDMDLGSEMIAMADGRAAATAAISAELTEAECIRRARDATTRRLQKAYANG